jgi:hypothetical protein
MADFVKLSPESFRTLYLRGENRVILLTEAGRRIIVERIVGSEWTPYRIYEFEAAKNENKREIFLIDRRYLNQVDEQLVSTLRNGS